jgi:hypothetical protein
MTTMTMVAAGAETPRAWSRSGNTLSFTDEEGTDVFSSVASLPSCDDYGFGGGAGLWSGTLTANVDGVATNFSTFLYAAMESGILGFGGNSGTQAIQFSLLSDEPGAYDLGGGNMGIYIPDTTDPTNMLTTVMGVATGTLNLTTLSATQIVGSFEFDAINLSTMESVSITGGVINMSTN